MDQDQSLREHLRKLLNWEDAHVNFDSAVEGIDEAVRGVVPEGFQHSPWQLLEHLRLTQHDILDFCINPNYSERSFPEDYWAKFPKPASASEWNESVAAFRRDRKKLQELAADPKVELFEKIPHGKGQTYLRELLLVADHNAYHVGQLVAVRRALGVWHG
jgi:uncharacterized damage-inducible protein DinB